MPSANPSSIAQLESQLNDFDRDRRWAALTELRGLAERGQAPVAAAADVANMHCHTLFSFNAYGYSPAALAWLAKRNGYKLLGIVDFDVLDAVDEFLSACDLVGVRGSAGLETRLFLPEFATREINSPGEPGVTYHMGIGFVSSVIPAFVQVVAAGMRERARQRNLGVIQRVNAYLDPVVVDYAGDVLPLTPGGNATERHIVAAYVAAADRLPDPARFWADRLGMDPAKTTAAMQDAQYSGSAAAFQNTVRSKLMKKGGPGYVLPGPDSFPTIEAFHKLIVACGALPCCAWLDGTSPGEQAMDELLELLVAKGVVTLNIIPDRNWNIADPATRQQKVANLYRVVELAREMALPLNVGTEMNSFGQKLVDDFAAPELEPVRQDFLDGAYFIYGHTVMQRHLDLGYRSQWAQAHLPDHRQRNAFYTQLGHRMPPGRECQKILYELSPDFEPADILRRLAN